MSAINILTFPKFYCFPQVCCDRVCGHDETHVAVLRTPIVSAGWTVEINRDGTRRLVERWSVNRQKDGQ